MNWLLKRWRFWSLWWEYANRDPWDVEGNKALYARALAAREILDGVRSSQASLEEKRND